MNRAPITSSNIASAGYDSDTRTMEVEFTTGRVFRYLNVPPAVYDAFLAAPSAGSFVHKRVRPFYAASPVDVETKAGA